MEVYDDPDSPNIVATFELPGVPIREIKISVKQGVLMIYGERHARYSPMAVANRHPSVRAAPSRPAEAGAMDVDRDSAAEDAHAKLFPVEELRYGRFQRAIRLPTGVDVSFVFAFAFLHPSAFHLSQTLFVSYRHCFSFLTVPFK
jgi:HSP20 family protein